MDQQRIGVAAVGDVLDINCWSNTPYYFFYAGQRAKLFSQPWSWRPEQLDFYRYYWNLKQVLLGRGKGGFQYSSLFLSQAESKIPMDFFSSTVISVNQTFPRASTVIKAGGRIFYYIDTTLYDLFNEAEYGIDIPVAMKEKAIEQERKNYASASGVITMGTWTHESLIDYYKLPLFKIHQILPGANIDLPHRYKFKGFTPEAGIGRDLILGFVGKDWKRKGLTILMGIRNQLAAKGYKVRIRAIGVIPEELKNTEGIEFTGFIDKQKDTAQFIDAIGSCDIGCLLSSTEALGISILEFLRVGVPVLGFYHQGLKDTLLEDASIRIPLNSTVEEMAARVENYILHPDSFMSLRSEAEGLSSQVTWDKTIQKFRELL